MLKQNNNNQGCPWVAKSAGYFHLHVLVLFVAAACVMIAGASYRGASASELRSCLAKFVGPDTRLQADLAKMRPPPQCPTNILVDRVKQPALVLEAEGVPKPVLGGMGLSEDTSGTAPFLALWILRFDSPVVDDDPLGWGSAIFGASSTTDLHFVAHKIGDRPAEVRGFSAGHSLLVQIQGETVTQARDRASGNGGRELICLSAVSRPAANVVIVCRSTTLGVPQQREMLQRMLSDDLGAIRF